MRTANRRIWASALALAVGVVAPGGHLLLVKSVHAQETEAEQAVHRFDIQAGPLSAALNRLAEQAGLTLSYDPSLTAGKHTGGLQGEHTSADALQRLLADTGLTARFDGASTVSLERNTASDSTRLAPLGVSGFMEDPYGSVDGYAARRSGTAMKSDIPIIDTPASIQVVPRDVIDDQNAQRLEDVARNVSGVQFGGSNGNRSDNVNVRGFSTGRFAKDGFLSASTFGDAGFLNLANIERVEVLKGPATVLYGQNEPGGLINLVTKKPQPDPFYDFTGTYGRFDFYRGEADVNQPLNEDGTVLARLSGAYQESDSFRDYFRTTRRAQIAPSLRWLASDRTTVDLQLEYYEQDQQSDRGVPVVDGRPMALPRSRYLGSRDDRAKMDEVRLHAVVEHAFQNGWELRTLARYADTSARFLSSHPMGLEPDNRTLNRLFYDMDQEYQNYGLQTNLSRELRTGAVSHQLLVGADANLTRFDSENHTAPIDPIDIHNPDYSAQPGAYDDPSLQDRRVDFYGIYLQNLMSFGEHWKVLLGARYDQATTRFFQDGDTVTDETASELSPRAGVVFQPWDHSTLYASYTTSFQPQLSGETASGDAFEPEEGEQIELGAKREWLGGRASTTLAVFELTRTNVATADPNNPGASIQTGEQRSRGVELDVAGEFLPGWRTMASLTYLDAEVTRDNTYDTGNRLPNVSRWSGSLWNVYAFQSPTLQGLELGAGLYAVGSRTGNLENSYDLPGYGRVDLLARYRVNPNLRLSLNVDNLLDKEHIEAPGGWSVYPGAPRTVYARVDLNF
ncbi:TonB-dependent siderophore receptor [Aquisalimonas asiatica]|uniref:Iron complex outermembrane recepter protein n=1 Tax=Aquisalimonas asiatica TaxID=406100 RepID=A0A1H8SZL2_9GAMM|nr:TonB-dependent receptor [Aquisalimonas asiatica]SEO83653.1 iron complex outermembrane recepter protein [Aquisalimonas asiatica]